SVKHKKCINQPFKLERVQPTGQKTTTNNTTLFATGKKLMICSIKRGHHPMTGKNNNDHQHNNSQ
ncbi:hypothetical protein ACDL34_11140, partial [Corynebacterium diphtheriae]